MMARLYNPRVTGYPTAIRIPDRRQTPRPPRRADFYTISFDEHVIRITDDRAKQFKKPKRVMRTAIRMARDLHRTIYVVGWCGTHRMVVATIHPPKGQR